MLTSSYVVITLRLPDILPLIAVTARFQKLTGPAVMPTLVAHRSSLLKFVIVQNNEYVRYSMTPSCLTCDLAGTNAQCTG